MVGSESCFIQVEIYDSLDDDDTIVMQFFDTADDSLFEISEEIETSEDIEEYAGQIVTFTKEKVKIVRKIYNHINSIKELCENSEPEIYYEKFITINYDFTNYE